MMATSLAQLKQMLLNEMKKAMSVVSEQSLAEMFKNTGEFYSGGSPIRYVRTGNLGSSPNTTALSSGGNQVSFEAYLDESGGYSTGTFSTSQVFSAAESGSSGILGTPGFWKRSEEQFQNILDSTMGSFFG